MQANHQQLKPDEPCTCSTIPYQNLSTYRELGMDSHFAEVSVLVCQRCGQHWLRYFYDHEAFTASGRWYLGMITSEQLSILTADQAKSRLETLSWYYYGGSYYNGQIGQSSGTISLFP